MRVDDDIGREAFAREGHVFLAVLDAAGTFLAVTRGEFVADLRDAN